VPVNFLALLTFLAVAALAAVLLMRRLPRAAARATGETVCLGCGTPARRLAPDSFRCPVCRHDVRELGLAAPKPGAFAGPLWRVITFSVILCGLVLLAAMLITESLPKVEYFSADADLWSQGQPYRRLVLIASGKRGPRREHFVGEIDADLFLENGDLFTLEIQSPPLRYRVIGPAGGEAVPWTAGNLLDESIILHWTAAAGLNTNDPDTLSIARQVHIKLREILGPSLPPLPPLPRVAGGSSGTGSSSSGSAGPPEYVAPIAVITGSLVWLAGVWVILRRRTGEPSTTPEPGVPS
jgi:hypothetical protein